MQGTLRTPQDMPNSGILKKEPLQDPLKLWQFAEEKTGAGLVMRQSFQDMGVRVQNKVSGQRGGPRGHGGSLTQEAVPPSLWPLPKGDR